LSRHPCPELIQSEASLWAALSRLMAVLQDTSCTVVPGFSSPLLKVVVERRLAELKKRKNRLNATSYKFCALLGHASHWEHWDMQSLCCSEILKANRSTGLTY